MTLVGLQLSARVMDNNCYIQELHTATSWLFLQQKPIKNAAGRASANFQSAQSESDRLLSDGHPTALPDLKERRDQIITLSHCQVTRRLKISFVRL